MYVVQRIKIPTARSHRHRWARPDGAQFDNYQFMPATYENTVLEEVLEPIAQCFTPDVARQIAGLQTSHSLQARLDDLVQKANEGELTVEERAKYEEYMEAIDLIGILQAKARKILSNGLLP